MTFENLLSELNFHQETEQAIAQKIKRDEKNIAEISQTAYQGENFEFALLKRKPFTRLVAISYLLLSKFEEYKAKQIPDQIILDTIRDLSLRAALYHAQTGKPGISKADVIWFRHLMNISIFKIGSLQFQPFQMICMDEETIGESYMTFTQAQKQALPAGSPVLNCHIQHGADLTPKAVDESFHEAKTFFANHYPQESFQAFLCYSWLLYPPMQEHLSPHSNIRHFANKFRVIADCPESEQAMT